jgi:microcystin-dependent protein
MIISKAGTFKLLRILGIFCAIAMGFVTLVGTSEDDATNAVGVDDSVEANADLTLDPVTVEKVGTTSIMAAGDDCNTISINSALEAVKDDIENYDNLDINSVELRYVSGSYTASWLPAEVTSFSCSLTITGEQSTTIAATAINNASGNLDSTLSQAQIDVINHYLNNRSEEFTYCVVCDDVELDSYSVTYEVEIGVKVKGDVDVL